MRMLLQAAVRCVAISTIAVLALLILVPIVLEREIFGSHAIGAVLTINAMLIIAVVPPPRAIADARLVCWLLPGPHLLAWAMVAAWYIGARPVRGPEIASPMEPAALTFGIFLGHMAMAGLNFPTSTRLGVLLILSWMHLNHQMYELGWQEPALIGSAGMLGLLCAELIVADRLTLRRLIKDAQTHRRADSRLNHLIKGQCGGAAALVDALLSLECDKTSMDEERACQREEMLRQIHQMLSETAKWCHKREAFVQLEQGTYQSVKIEGDLHSELQAVLGLRAVVDVAVSKIKTDFTILRLVVHEIGSNAVKYSEPGKPIHAMATVVHGHPGDGNLHISIRNSNRAGHVPLSPEECALVFQAGFRKACFSAGDQTEKCSNGLGLSSVRLAIERIGGKVWMRTDEEYTTVHFTLPAAIAGDDHALAGSSRSPSATKVV